MNYWLISPKRSNIIIITERSGPVLFRNDNIILDPWFFFQLLLSFFYFSILFVKTNIRTRFYSPDFSGCLPTRFFVYFSSSSLFTSILPFYILPPSLGTDRRNTTFIHATSIQPSFYKTTALL